MERKQKIEMLRKLKGSRISPTGLQGVCYCCAEFSQCFQVKEQR